MTQKKITKDQVALALENLTNVSLVGEGAPTDGQVLTFNETSSEWFAQTPSGGGGGSEPVFIGHFSGGNGTTFSFTGQEFNATFESAVTDKSSPDITISNYPYGLLVNRAGYYKLTLHTAINPYSPPNWPDNLTQFGTSLSSPGGVFGPSSSRHSTWTGSVPQNFQGLALNTQAPSPENARFTDEYVVFANQGDNVPISIYAANYTAQFNTYAATIYVTAQWIGS